MQIAVLQGDNVEVASGEPTEWGQIIVALVYFLRKRADREKKASSSEKEKGTKTHETSEAWSTGLLRRNRRDVGDVVDLGAHRFRPDRSRVDWQDGGNFIQGKNEGVKNYL